MKRILVCLVVLSCILFQNSFVFALGNHPRDYVPGPPGLFGVLLYYDHSTADTLYCDGRKANDNLKFKGDVGILRFVHFWEFAGLTWFSDLLFPFGTLDMDMNSPIRQGFYASGMGDPIWVFGLWFYQNKQSMASAAFSTYVFFPIGDYDNYGVLSLGANQWLFREELNFTKGFSVLPGHNAFFEVTLIGDFFTDNDDYSAESYTCSKDPILTVESHLSYDITSSLFASADYYYHNGGETEVCGFNQNDQLDKHSLGCSLGYMLTPSFQILVQYVNDFAVEGGLKTQSINTRLFYMFDIGRLFGRSAAAKK
ncbi:MAG: transporter [Syntrophobacteraceae bacterium]